MGWLDTGRQFGGEGLVVEVVVKVGQHGPPRTRPGDPFEAEREMGMGRVRAIAQGVEDQEIEPISRGQASSGMAETSGR